jgi:type I restriction enzyme M protein
MISKMRSPQDGGSRIGIVFNGSPLFTGDAGSGESEIRKWIITSDWLEVVVALPDQLFYNTGISTYLWILTNRKEPDRKGKVQLIDARDFYIKMRKSLGNKRNEIGDGTSGRPDQIGEITRIYSNFRHNEIREVSIDGQVKKRCHLEAIDNAVWSYGEWGGTLQGEAGPVFVKGYFSAIYVREGDDWKMRILTLTEHPRPAPPAETK